MIDIIRPSINGGTEKEQVEQIKSYLHKLAEQLQWALSTTETAQISDEQKNSDISRGETDGWEWIKYANGIAECWMRKGNEGKAITTQWGTLYYGECDEVRFPFKFAEKPVVSASVESNAALFLLSWKGTEGSGYTSTSKPAPLRVAWMEPQDSVNFTITYHAIGRWK